MKNITDIDLVRVSEDSFKMDVSAFRGNTAFKTALNIGFKYSIASRVLKTTVSVSFYRLDDDKTSVLEATGSMMFALGKKLIESYSVDDELVLPSEFQIQTAHMTTGMVRGIIVSHMTQAGLVPLILPILNEDNLNIRPIVLKRQ